MAYIYEIRDYTIEPEWFPAYKEWAKLVVPWLKENMDEIDFWIDDGLDCDTGGSDPRQPPHGQPNVCWIIRWSSREERDEKWAEVQANPEFQEIWSKHPNENAYLIWNARFMRSI